VGTVGPKPGFLPAPATAVVFALVLVVWPCLSGCSAKAPKRVSATELLAAPRALHGQVVRFDACLYQFQHGISAGPCPAGPFELVLSTDKLPPKAAEALLRASPQKAKNTRAPSCITGVFGVYDSPEPIASVEVTGFVGAPCGA
jgi:hypothetical protein